VVDPEQGGGPAIDVVAEACPTHAISVTEARVELDRGRCILCGRCTELFGETFRFDPNFEISALRRGQLVVPDLYEDDATLDEAREELGRRTRALRRSIHIRHVDAGSDGSEEWEVAALTNPIYDVQRLGIFFTASPKHADVLLVTGVGTTGMVGPLQHTFDVMPEPKVVIAAGVDAISGGMLGQGYASLGGVDGTVPVDVFVPGSPPTPFGLLHGILLAVGLLPGISGHKRNNRGSLERTAHGPTSHHYAEDPPREVGP
jgi:Ni,Fe-hydrogenase III small subunit/ferredoxin